MTDDERMKLDPYGEENWNDDEQPTNSTNFGLLDHRFTRRFVIPVGGISKEQAKQHVIDMMGWYRVH